MTFVQAVQACFSKYGTFDGRATRSEFWWFYLANIVTVWVAYFIFALAGYAVGGQVYALIQSNLIQLIINLVFFIPFLAVSSRRLHDTNRSAWWFLLAFTLVGLIPLVMWWAQQGTPDANQYGPAVDGIAIGGVSEEEILVQPAVAMAASVKTSSKSNRIVKDKAADFSDEVQAGKKVSSASPTQSDQPQNLTYRPTNSSGGPTAASLIGLIVLLVAIAAAALYLKPWGTEPSNVSAREDSSVADANSSAPNSGEAVTRQSEADRTKSTVRRAEQSDRERPATIEAGDVSIEEGADGQTRIRAGDIEIED